MAQQSEDYNYQNPAKRRYQQASKPHAALGTMATDPICREAVDRASSPKSQYDGETYYFCGEDHRDEFEREPTKYLTSR
jgi:YHS domain-containing protein